MHLCVCVCVCVCCVCVLEAFHVVLVHACVPKTCVAYMLDVDGLQLNAKHFQSKIA